MINYKGAIISESELPVIPFMRSMKYGDGLFETMRMREGKLLFIEDHYFRLMAGMRILRMEIPMEFTPEFFVNEAKKLADAMGHINARVRLQLVRIANGKYTPVGDVGVSWWMELEPLEKSDYSLNERGLKVELFKDHYVQPGLLSTLKSSNSLLYVLAGIFAQENGYDQMLLINDEKMVVESNLGNIFVLKDDVLSTPPLESGALRGVFRKNLLSFAEDLKIKVVEEKINPFSLQKADEIWLTNTVQGVQWVEQYRKKVYSGEKAKELVAMLNRKLNVLGNL